MDTNRIPQTVPAEYGGKWLIWTKDALRIAGIGATLEEAEQAARKAGVVDGVIEWAPPADELIIL